MESISHLRELVERAWSRRETLANSIDGPTREAIATVLEMLDRGAMRVAEKIGSAWVVHEWIKKAVILSFGFGEMRLIEGANGGGNWWDKVPSKFADWDAETFRSAGFRAVPGSIVRKGAHIAKNVVLMPSFVNIGAYVGEGTMVDTWASIGSCAQIGKHCHISAGAGIGGVLEPLQAKPTVIEDNCFIGARSEVVEGLVVEEGAVLSMGVFITATTKIVDRYTGECFIGRVPAYSVVVPGTLPGGKSQSGDMLPNLSCAVIVKRVDRQTRTKISINELLRD